MLLSYRTQGEYTDRSLLSSKDFNKALQTLVTVCTAALLREPDFYCKLA